MKRCGVEDIEDVHRILKHPDIWGVITDDGACSKEEFDMTEVLKNDKVYVLLPEENILFLFFPVNAITWDGHINALKDSRGEKARQATIDVMEYMFTKTPCQKIIVYIAEIFSKVISHVIRCGFGQEGCLIGSYLKNGKIYNQHILGITKTEFHGL